MQDSSTSQCLPLRKKRYRSATIALLFALAGCSWPALAQVMNTTSESSEYSPSQSSATSIPSSVGSLNQNPFTGSVAEGKVSPEVLPLSFKDAIDRCLRNNLGLLLQSDSVIAARGQRWKELSDLLPNLSASQCGGKRECRTAESRGPRASFSFQFAIREDPSDRRALRLFRCACVLEPISF